MNDSKNKNNYRDSLAFFSLSRQNWTYLLPQHFFNLIKVWMIFQIHCYYNLHPTLFKKCAFSNWKQLFRRTNLPNNAWCIILRLTLAKWIYRFITKQFNCESLLIIFLKNYIGLMFCRFYLLLRFFQYSRPMTNVFFNVRTSVLNGSFLFLFHW